MLSRLQVKNYVLIDSLDIDFPEGLVIITGQTGANQARQGELGVATLPQVLQLCRGGQPSAQQSLTTYIM